MNCPELDTDEVLGALTARAEKAEAEVERLRGALVEIAAGKMAVDSEMPLNAYLSMTMRFLTIAQDALRLTGAKTDDHEEKEPVRDAALQDGAREGILPRPALRWLG